MPPTTTPTPSTPSRAESGPVWARATAAFCKGSFDVRSREDFVDALEAFAELAPGEQAFHHAHLVFRQVQALEDLHRVLSRIDARLAGLDPDSLAGLKHLPAIRKALVTIAKGQDELLDLLASGPGSGAVAGEEEDEDLGDDVQDDDEPSDGDEDVDSDLADAMDDEEVEEEDHGNGDAPALIPEVLPAGARPDRSSLTAEEALFAERDGGGA